MKNNIHFFETGKVPRKDVLDQLGARGRQVVELAGQGHPIVPGFVVDSSVSHTYKDEALKAELAKLLTPLGERVKKIWNSPERPLLVKVVVSPSIQVLSQSIHNVGLTRSTAKGFESFVGADATLTEISYLLKGLVSLEKKWTEARLEEAKAEEAVKPLQKLLDQVHAAAQGKVKLKGPDAAFDLAANLLPGSIFESADAQLLHILGRFRDIFAQEASAEGALGDNDTALLVQAMVYGNFGKNSGTGDFFTRNVVTGEKVIQGHFIKNQFASVGEGEDISKVEKSYYEQMTKMAAQIEVQYKEIRQLRFTIEDGKLWLIEQRVVNDKSTRADIQLLLDLLKQKKIDEAYVIKAIQPSQLNELLHPVIKPASVKALPASKGGISGAPGAAIGRVYFTADSLMAAHREAKRLGESDPKLILVMPSTYANDVKAVEVAKGVLSSEGGYSAHASVVARQYGKVSLVKPEIKFGKDKVTLGDWVLKEGDYVTLHVPYYGEPVLYRGQGELIQSNPEESGLLDFLTLVKKYVKGFHVRANADTPRDAALALKFGAEGIGLCRTEHMFFDASRIHVFREMILAETREDREKVLKRLQAMQKEDFLALFRIMAGKVVTVRLLDPPLHEFLPHTSEEAQKFVEHLSKGKKSAPLTVKQVLERTEELHEFNPMLGHRGSRLAVTYPEIYEMQMNAVLEALETLQAEGLDVHAEVMLPVIMNENELKTLINGKRIEGMNYKGLQEVLDQFNSRAGKKTVHLDFGTMVEIPAAALGAGKLAKYARFFSFGTNDLTQTSLGLSRDDFNSFMPDYTRLDLLNGNPFKYLDPQVKELIQIAVQRGTMTRPDLSKGLCGEHGAVPENIEFCIETGLDYVSSSPYSIPLANLAIAQYNLKKQGD